MHPSLHSCSTWCTFSTSFVAFLYSLMVILSWTVGPNYYSFLCWRLMSINLHSTVHGWGSLESINRINLWVSGPGYCPLHLVFLQHQWACYQQRLWDEFSNFLMESLGLILPLKPLALTYFRWRPVKMQCLLIISNMFFLSQFYLHHVYIKIKCMFNIEGINFCLTFYLFAVSYHTQCTIYGHDRVQKGILMLTQENWCLKSIKICYNRSLNIS